MEISSLLLSILWKVFWSFLCKIRAEIFVNCFISWFARYFFELICRLFFQLMSQLIKTMGVIILLWVCSIISSQFISAKKSAVESRFVKIVMSLLANNDISNITVLLSFWTYIVQKKRSINDLAKVTSKKLRWRWILLLFNSFTKMHSLGGLIYR